MPGWRPSSATSAPPEVPPVSQCQYAEAIHAAFDPVGVGDTMVRIAWRESNCQPTARNASGASGLFQLMLPLHADLFTGIGYSPDQWSDPYVNIAVARHLYDMAGMSPWAL